ncbi:MAG TPA: hypothetical protein V6C76_14065 [Drouetiella sp.]
MLITFLSRVVPGFEAACTRLRLNHGKCKDGFTDIRFLINHYLERGELERAESLSCSLVALAEGDSVYWVDPEKVPTSKSLRFRRKQMRATLQFATLLLLPVLIASHHQVIFRLMAKNDMDHGKAREAISMLRAELAIEHAFGAMDTNLALNLADALICDNQIKEADMIVHNLVRQNPKDDHARYIELQLAMMTSNFAEANRDALILGNQIGKKELIATLLFTNVLNGHGPYTDFETLMQLSKFDRGLTAYKVIKNSVPESETYYKLCAAMGYFCKANGDDKLAARWFKRAMERARISKFKCDRVRYIDAAKQYVALTEHLRPLESRRLEWTAMGLAQQANLPYETFEEKVERDEISLLQ